MYLCEATFVFIVFTHMDDRPWMKAIKYSFKYRCMYDILASDVQISMKHLKNDKS